MRKQSRNLMAGAGASQVNSEYDDLVTSLEEDEGVSAAIDHLPLPEAASGAVINYRDLDDVRTIRQLSWTIIFLLALVLSLTGALIYKMLMKPIMIVEDRASGETLVIDGREIGGRTSSLAVGPEELTPQGKISIVTHFLEKLYQIDPATRTADINSAIRMMDPDGALAFSRYLKEKQILETQATEGWQATWKLQDLAIDERDPYLVRAIGEQTVRRRIDGELKQETRQLSVKLLLSVSRTEPKRNDNNFNTGFCVSKFKAKPLNEQQASAVVLMSDEDK